MIAALLIASAAPLHAESPAEILERGVFQQETRNDPAAALKIYQEVLDRESQSRELSSEARYRMAMCLIALGEEAKGHEQLEALAHDTAADKQWAGKAAAGLAKTQFIHPAPWKPGEIAIYRILGPGNQDMGFMMAAVKETTVDGESRWASYFIRAGAQWGISCSIFSKETFEPVSSRLFMDGFGDFLTEHSGGGAVVVKNFDGSDVQWQRKAGESTLPLYDNDQAVQLLRLLPQTIGTKVQSEIAICFSPKPLPFTMEVTAEKTVQTDAGSFDCVEIVTNIGQNFWISRDPSRRMIKMKVGLASIEASKFLDWNPDKPTEYTASKNGVHIVFPAGVLWGPPIEKEKSLRLYVYPTDFSAFGGILDIKKTADLPETVRTSSQALARADLAEDVKLFEESEIVREGEFDLPGWKVWKSFTHERRGKVNSFTFHIHAVGPEKSISFNIAYPKGGEDAVEKLATAIVEGITLK